MKISPQSKRQTNDDELAAAKLWAVYISEADKYDKALVENWKSDIDGILIFAGLFSASLTAFLIESYETLSPDQGAITIAVLAQISLQLDPHSNASSIDMSTFAAAPPSPTSLVVHQSLVQSFLCPHCDTCRAMGQDLHPKNGDAALPHHSRAHIRVSLLPSLPIRDTRSG
ncbi:hypothetical protein C8R44DRAFT_58222 [Mycena epipterygia]|nr:hypothetical protein C8R44DRAFT_58222 [Mycena epipterygia]